MAVIGHGDVQESAVDRSVGSEQPEPSHTTNASLLVVQDLRVAFGDNSVLGGVNLVIERGQRIGLVGESGSGKSMTALAVMRLIPQAAVTGSVRLTGLDLLGLPRRRMERIRGSRVAMIYQDPMSSLNPVHSIGKQLGEALRLHTGLRGKAVKDRAIELLDEVGIVDPHHRVNAYPHEFSGGQRQRVMIAMALCGSPELLIADEPTTALDVTTQARILDLLDRIVDERRMAVLLITHDLGVAAGFCDEICVMHHGRLVERSPAQQLFASPHDDYTRGLINNLIDMTTDVDAPIATVGAERTPAPGPRPPNVQTTSSPLIEVSDVRKRFGGASRSGVTALDGVSFTIHRGETFGLVGESGSGKTTMSRGVLGLTRLDAGVVTFDGIDVHGQRGAGLRALRRRMQVVFQDPFAALNRRQSALQLVAAPLAAHRIGTRAHRRARAEAALKRVGIDEALRGRLPRELSGGQCQRVAIARALVLEPEFVVLDESVSALDASIRAQVLNLLRELQAELGLTFLFVSHDLAVIRYMCSRLAVMHSGRIIETGTREEVFTAPQQEYTKALLAAAPIADPTVEKARRRAHRTDDAVPDEDQ